MSQHLQVSAKTLPFENMNKFSYNVSRSYSPITQKYQDSNYKRAFANGTGLGGGDKALNTESFLQDMC